MYVHSLHTRGKLTKTERETTIKCSGSYHKKLTMTAERQRDRQKERQTDNYKAQGIVPYLFSFKGGSLEKARSQLAKFHLSRN